MRSTVLGSHVERTCVQPIAPRRRPATPAGEPKSLRASFSSGVYAVCTTSRCTCAVKPAIVVLYASVTILDLLRGAIHTFLYDIGLDDISGLSTGDAVCDGRLAALMVAYGGANLESFLVRAYVLYKYARYDSGRDLVRITSIASATWAATAAIGTAIGDVDVGDAEVPGRYAMLVRAVVSLGTVLLTFVGPNA